MATSRQALGERGEKAVCQRAPCPRCNRPRHFRQLRVNFECADVICKFCGFLAQVKSTTLKPGEELLTKRILGAAWAPQQERIIAGIYHGLYVAAFAPGGTKLMEMIYVPPHVLAAAPEVFEPRKPLSATAKRAGWTGYLLNLAKVPRVGAQQVFLES